MSISRPPRPHLVAEHGPRRVWAAGLLCLVCWWPLSCSDSTDGSTPGPGLDAGADFDACFSNLAAGQWFTEVQGFKTDDDAVHVFRARRPGPKPAVGETFAYELVRFFVASTAETACVSDAGALDYEYAHHNWNEKWRAQTATRRYLGTEQRIFDEQTSWRSQLTIQSADGQQTLLGPVSLEGVTCFTVPPGDPNACTWRKRTDVADAAAP
jgi:hypothetical protein